MSQTVTFRLPDGTADWLKASARRTGRSVNELGAALFEEARRVSEFAEIEFRTFNGERHACIKGNMQIWQIIAVAQGYMMNVEQTSAHFGWPAWKVQAAFNYFAAFPEEIEQAIADNAAMDEEKLRRLFPHLQVIEVASTTPDAKANVEAG